MESSVNNVPFETVEMFIFIQNSCSTVIHMVLLFGKEKKTWSDKAFVCKTRSLSLSAFSVSSLFYTNRYIVLFTFRKRKSTLFDVEGRHAAIRKCKQGKRSPFLLHIFHDIGQKKEPAS